MMTKKEERQRQTVIKEAESWLLTPHHHQGRVKNGQVPGELGGVDCLMLIAEVFTRTGLIEPLPDLEYAEDGHLHHSEDLVRQWVEKYAYPVARSRPGDLVLYQYGRRLSHGGIVVAWPLIIHAKLGRAVEYGDGEQESSAGHRPADRVFYRLKGWEAD